MKIYVAHSRAFDYENELYKPLRESSLNEKVEIILPHEKSEELFNSKEELKNVDYVIAEVSYPSTGVGIELGWANAYNTPIILVYKTGSVISASAGSVATKILEYSSSEELVQKIQDSIPLQ
jgi:predicted DNA-binding antitoxin AbrB/MazE fold protein